ncbi:MAG: Rne/Rng family ribonuclease [Microthrixaceae bacterium]
MPDSTNPGEPPVVTGPANAPLVPKIPPPGPVRPPSGSAETGPTDTPGGGAPSQKGPAAPGQGTSASAKRRRRRRAANAAGDAAAATGPGSGSGSQTAQSRSSSGPAKTSGQGGQRRKKGPRPSPTAPVTAVLTDDHAPELDGAELETRRGRSRKGKAVGRYQMNVHVDAAGHTHIAVLEGRTLVEHYVSRPSDDVSQIHGNIYLGKVENVLPGMEAAFIDIATPKNAVIYRGDITHDAAGNKPANDARIESLLKARQLVMCQVTKNPIGHKGARLTEEVSLPGRFVVLVPNSTVYGISKRLPDSERKRLRSILDKAKPAQHGVIVRTAAQNVSADEISRDVARLLGQWEQIEALAAKQSRPTLLYCEPDMAVRIIREEFNDDFRAVVIDDEKMYREVHEYVGAISPGTADRVQYYDLSSEKLALFERYRITEQLKKGLDRKVWLPSGGSLIIEHTEALTVIDVNTGRNVGSSSLEETVFKNNLEAATEIARQLRLRDIGGIIVVDFIDMEVKANRDELVKTFRTALAQDKTRTQVFAVSELGLVEMTRKRIGEGLLESFAEQCSVCEGRGVVMTSAIAGLD